MVQIGLEPIRPKDRFYRPTSQPIAQLHHLVAVPENIEISTLRLTGACSASELRDIVFYVDLPRFELGTKACKAIVLANYTISPYARPKGIEPLTFGFGDHCST